jgi:hypothetical protein
MTSAIVEISLYSGVVEWFHPASSVGMPGAIRCSPDGFARDRSRRIREDGERDADLILKVQGEFKIK